MVPEWQCCHPDVQSVPTDIFNEVHFGFRVGGSANLAGHHLFKDGDKKPATLDTRNVSKLFITNVMGHRLSRYVISHTRVK